MNTTSLAARTLTVALLLLATPAAVRGELIYATANQGAATSIVSFDSARSSQLLSARFVSGLQPNETLLGIDLRPATRQVYGLGSSSRLYIIDPSTGAATPVGGQFSTQLNGFDFGVDFDPQIDRLRIVSDLDQNLVIDPNTGAVETVATDVHYLASQSSLQVPDVVHLAYDRNFPGTTGTQLFGVDTGQTTFFNFDLLVRQANNSGVLTAVGSMGLGGLIGYDPPGVGGFDISGASGIAYIAVTNRNANQSTLFTVNLTTGSVSPINFDRETIGAGLIVTGLTVALIPEPTTASLILGLVGLPWIRRRA